MNLKKKNSLIGLMFASPAIVGVLLFYLVPYVMSIYYSFTQFGQFPTFDNYASLFSNAAFGLALKNTAVFSAIAIPLAVIIPFLIALFLNTFDKHIEFFRSLFLSPLIVPIASVIFVWQIVFSDTGIINGVVNSFGFAPIYFFNGQWSMVIVILIFVWKNCAYNIILFSAGLAKISKEIKESARLDGATSRQIVWYIVIPIINPTVFFVILLTIISSFKIFREIYLLYGAYPDENVYMLQHFMNNNFYNLNYPRLSTASIILSVFIITILFIIFKFDKKIIIESL
ncbi:sugar ABC transporter permease [Clostridia bacterium]|nr:sugar ABC transporter permease [Clostridia bacterium]